MRPLNTAVEVPPPQVRRLISSDVAGLSSPSRIFIVALETSAYFQFALFNTLSLQENSESMPFPYNELLYHSKTSSALQGVLPYSKRR